MPRFLIAALYKFARTDAGPDLQSRLMTICQDNAICGTLLLADEGINGTVAGPEAGVRTLLAALRDLPGMADLEHKESWADSQPFLRLKVRLKKEIVTMGVNGVDPSGAVGVYVEPEDWNDLIQQPDVVTIDTRNDYEVQIGQFEGAINPQTVSFREFPDWFRKFRSDRPNTRLAMYCTGGIRCEKATSWIRDLGEDEVYHLKGGILKYLENIPQDESLWRGDCFVFDRRVSVKHGLEPGDLTSCFACRAPLGPEDLKSPDFIAGEACPHCIHTRSDAERARYRERHKQENLAHTRGERHVGRQTP